MADSSTPDGQPKIAHLNHIVRSVLERLGNSSKCNSFKVAFVYFSTTVVHDQPNGIKYFNLQQALERFRDPIEVVGGQHTAIADALDVAFDLLDEFNSDEGVPNLKHATILLFTDGIENIRNSEAVKEESNRIIAHNLAPSLATISFGTDADETLLEIIATSPNERQLQHLRNANVLQHLPNRKKLFLIGHEAGVISEEKVNAIRNFVETLSKTAIANQER
jgi:hypothetical protein